jgi:hypothetical protein
VTLRAGAGFEKGNLVERPDESGGDQQVAEHTDPRVLIIPLAPILVRVNRSRRRTSRCRWRRHAERSTASPKSLLPYRKSQSVL